MTNTNKVVVEPLRIHRGDPSWATLEPWLLKQAESCLGVLATPSTDLEKTADARGRWALIQQILGMAQYALSVTLKDKK